jgi:hypothetical protein
MRKTKQTWSNKFFHFKLFLVAILMLVLFRETSIALHHIDRKVKSVVFASGDTTPLLSPVSLPFPTTSPHPSPLPTPFIPKGREAIIAEIKQVFGTHADKAFMLLSCENPDFDPNIVNTLGNYPEGSRDIGIFQINEYWQQVQGKFLFNPHINIQVAHQVYEENDNTFKMWTCGRRLGI